MSEDALVTVAKLMELAARTAPKAVGKDFIEIKILNGTEKDAVGKDMIKIGDEREKPGFKRDGQNVLDAGVLVLIGLLKHPGLGIDCKGCGFENCAEFNKKSAEGDMKGPNCVHRMADLGIAVGSAAKTASMNNADNRIMERVGISARRLHMMQSNVIYGIPLSATGKNIFFDRKPT
jgi:uncharacterized ferredoxin-like protein